MQLRGDYIINPIKKMKNEHQYASSPLKTRTELLGTLQGHKWNEFNRKENVKMVFGSLRNIQKMQGTRQKRKNPKLMVPEQL